MYESHFGLRQRPFRATPDCECYYPATGHEQALARLLQALAEDEGVVLLSGAPGMGKTLLCQVLDDRLGEDIACAFLTNSHVSDRTGLLQAILYDLVLPYAGHSEQELRLALTDHLLKNYGAGRRTVLIMDEAQHLTPDLLEELRLLGNLEGRQGKALHIVLVAQPDLLVKLRRPELSAFRQRLAVRVHLEPLTVNEAADYLLHHLRAAGGRPEAILADEAVEILARSTRGVPRLLNQAAHRALAVAHSAGAELVDAEAAMEALTQLDLEIAEDTEEGGEPVGAADPLAAVSNRTTTEDDIECQPMLCVEEEKDEISLTRSHAEEAGRVHRLFASPRRPA